MMSEMFIPKSYRRLKRGPQVILPKDIGMVLTYTGVDRNSVCVDAGTGSGWLAVSLARVCKEVYSYDTRDEFTKIAEKNKANERLDNLTLKKGDVTKSIKEKGVDLVTLDMPNAEKAVNNAHKALKPGGYIFGYLPHMEQVRKFTAALERKKFADIVVLESIVRDMLVREQGMRPSTKGVWHTAYLVFAQKA
ncbi:MAG: methyltransferase domain-containing protein [Candidatus Micrarchaeota archaeon]|nr:methyltransferase domain-containing protein [Candidatus Micrarchaeota archaeon]